MGSSYLPSGVLVNCTLMTVTKPQNLGISRTKKDVKIIRKSALILNIDDKKISDTFKCKSPAKFFDGLASMCLGIAVGLLAVAAAVVIVAAIVGTGGVAGVIIAGMAEAAITTAVVGSLGAALVSPISYLIGEYKQSHECDCTLDPGSMWIDQHPHVTIDGKKALLQKSILKCTKKGLIQPFIDSAIANEVALKFSSNNNKELDEHNEQQLWMGVVNGFSTLGDPLGTAIGVAFAGYEYYDGNDDETLANESATEEADDKTDWHNGTRDNAVGTVAGAGKGTKDVVEAITEQNKTIIRELMDQGASYEVASQLTGFGEKTFGSEFLHTGVGLGVGLGFGVAGAVGNHYIAKHYKEKKVELIREVKEIGNEAAGKDAENNIGIIANKGKS